LSNDCYLPVSEPATDRLALGDLLYSRLLAEEARGEASGDRAWTAVFEAWRAALTESEPGSSVPPRPVGPRSSEPSPWPDLDGTAERRTEGVEAAVLRRIDALEARPRELWSARFESLAAESLAASLDREAGLARVERLHPGTRSAARAALLLAERMLEQGRPLVARTWIERGLAHLPRGVHADLRAALVERERMCDALFESASKGEDAWERASALVAVSAQPVFDGSPRADKPPALGGGVRPGMVFTDSGLAVLQLPSRLTFLDAASARPVAVLEWQDALEPLALIVHSVHAPSDPPGWVLQPASDGNAIIAVHGRSLGTNSNLIACIEPPRRGSVPALDGAPRVRWVVHGDRTYDGRGNESVWPRDRDPMLRAGGEIQPGPLVLGTQVLVQVRRAIDSSPSGSAAPASERQSWILSIDLVTGLPLWSRFTARGVELSRDQGRMYQGVQQATAGQPLVSLGTTIFAGTHLGAGVLVDAADGRVRWSIKNRRRDPRSGGWTGWTPVVDRGAEARSGLLWAPADSDHLYWLADARVPAGRGPLRRLPRAIGEAEALLGGGLREALVLSRAGARRTLSAWNAESGGRIDALYLSPQEHFSGSGLVSPQRAIFATERGIYLFDRTRELSLSDYEPLAEVAGLEGPRRQAFTRGGAAPAGGSVFGHSNRVFVLGREALWAFAAE